MQIEIIPERCMGSGNCGFWAPGAFDLDDEGIAIVVDPAGAPEDSVRLAAEACPTRALKAASPSRSRPIVRASPR